MARLKEMISELIEVNRAVLRLLESQQVVQPITRQEMMLGSADDAINRLKALSKQKRFQSKSIYQ